VWHLCKFSCRINTHQQDVCHTPKLFGECASVTLLLSGISRHYNIQHTLDEIASDWPFILTHSKQKNNLNHYHKSHQSKDCWFSVLCYCQVSKHDEVLRVGDTLTISGVGYYSFDVRGRAVPEGECIHIRQCTPACVALKKSAKSLKSIAMSAMQTQSNKLVAKMVARNISSLFKQKLI